jgi:hypothetical protein
MPLDEDSHQLLGFVELNARDLYDKVGKQYGRSTGLDRNEVYI